MRKDVYKRQDLKSFEGYTPGHVIVLRHHPRSYPAAYVTASKDVTFRDVKIYHCAGMGVIAQFTENITLERVAITGKPGNGHWFLSLIHIWKMP